MNSECLQMNELLLTLYGTKNREAAFRNTLQALKETIAFDKGDIYFYDSSSEQPKMKTFISVGWDHKELDKYLNDYYQIDDVLPLISSKKSIMFRSSDIFSSEDRKASAYYLRALKPLGMEYSIEGSICCVGNIIGGIGLHRGIKRGEFTSENVEFMKILASHLRNVATDYVTSVDDLPQMQCLSSGFCVSYVLWDNNRSIEWDNLNNLGISTVDKTTILKKLFALSINVNEEKSLTQPISIKNNSKDKCGLISRDYLVTVSKVIDKSSKQYYCAILIDFNRLMDDAFSSVQETINLTKRELQIVRLAMNGAETSDIAKTLYVDISTVKKHLTNSYQKMGINGKHQIINFLLRGERF